MLGFKMAALQYSFSWQKSFLQNMEQFRLQLEYEETRTSGPLFETMKAKLAGIASHSGMEGVG